MGMWWTRRRRVTVAGSVSVAVAAFLTLALVPVPQHFALREVAVHDLETTCTGIFASAGTRVTFDWSAPSNISFGAWSCAADSIVYWGNGTGGAGGFTSGGGVYEFGSICPGTGPCVAGNVSGTYTSPLLPL
jgi:hypothetical protein